MANNIIPNRFCRMYILIFLFILLLTACSLPPGAKTTLISPILTFTELTPMQITSVQVPTHMMTTTSSSETPTFHLNQTPASTIISTPFHLEDLQIIFPENSTQLTQIGRLEQGRNIVTLAFSPDGDILAVGCADERNQAFVNLWDVSTGRLLFKFQTNSRFIADLAFSSDGQTLAAATLDTRILLWNVSTGDELVPPTGGEAPVSSLAFNPNGITLAYGFGITGNLFIWDLQNKQLLYELKADIHDVNTIAFTNDGNKLISGGWDSTVRIWNPDTGELLLDFGVLGDEVNTDNGTQSIIGYTIYKIATGPDGLFAVSACAAECIVQIRNANSGTFIYQITEYPGVTGAIFSPDGQILLLENCIDRIDLVCQQSEIVLLEAVNLTLLTRIENAMTVAISPGGRLVATGNSEGFVYLLGVPNSHP